MARYMPGSQNRALMAEKEEIAVLLLRRGLTPAQIALQLRCSPAFVRRVRSGITDASGDGDQVATRARTA